MYLPDHSHCKYCGETTEYGDDYCNDQCKANFEAESKAEKMKDYKFYGLIAVSLIAILIVGIIAKVFMK